MANAFEPDLNLFRAIRREFKAHLQLEGNYRTVLSGKFGSGKTTFLDHFFKQEEGEFIALTLFPVNYSIASNEDIFQYIKYDLLIELLRVGEVGLEDCELGFSGNLYLYIKDNWKEVGVELVQHAAELEKDQVPGLDIMGKIAGFMLGIKKQVDKKAAELVEQFDEYKAVVEFMEQTRGKAGSLYEDTFLTTILAKLIGKLKETKKQVVLAIEDLDRIDPEHIFRILNIFSAHFDGRLSNGENRFAVDTIVLVFDEANVRNIFANRYGADVDYTGYIDKFYSYSIFNFDYAALLQGYIGKLLNQLKLVNEDGYRVADSIPNVVLGDGFVQFITYMLLDNKMTKIRALNRVLRREIICTNPAIKFGAGSVPLANASMILELLIISELCGGIEQAIRNFDRLKSITRPFDHRRRVFERLLAIIIGAREGFEKKGPLYISLGSKEYYGTMGMTQDHEYVVNEFKMREGGNERGIDHIWTDELFLVMVEAYGVIQSVPGLRLHSYYFGS